MREKEKISSQRQGGRLTAKEGEERYQNQIFTDSMEQGVGGDGETKAIYGAPLTVPGEFLGSPESSFLCKIKNAVAGF